MDTIEIVLMWDCLEKGKVLLMYMERKNEETKYNNIHNAFYVYHVWYL